MRMRRIETPAWAPAYAREHAVQLSAGVTPAEHQRVQECRPQLLEAHHRAVEEYRRTGGPLSVSVSIMARCLGYRPARWGDEARDYLGIDVVLLFDAESGTFSTFYTGGSVI
jgi:hypothetical protein